LRGKQLKDKIPPHSSSGIP